jgi:3-dehydroquinate synthase
VAPAKVQIWIDDQVADANPQWTDKLQRSIRAMGHLELTRPAQPISGGEVCKVDTSNFERILELINRDELDRRSYIVVVGGGAVLDTVGFAAAIAHRGIRLVRFPSTTLSQDDSGVGVKNAINSFGKKNWQGTFSVPWAVVNDYALLRSLPKREFISGFSEAVKVTLLKSAEGFAAICKSTDAICSREETVCRAVIEQSAALHMAHITEGGDPFELLEARPLDFGHWSAHKLEAVSDYSIRHGDAVAIGLAIDALYSVRKTGLKLAAAARVIECLLRLGLPIWHQLLQSHQAEILGGLEEFRQHLGGRLTVTLLEAVGKPVNVHEIQHDVVAEVIDLLSELHHAAMGHQERKESFCVSGFLEAHL